MSKRKTYSDSSDSSDDSSDDEVPALVAKKQKPSVANSDSSDDEDHPGFQYVTKYKGSFKINRGDGLKYESWIEIDGKLFWIGTYDNAKDAAVEYDRQLIIRGLAREESLSMSC